MLNRTHCNFSILKAVTATLAVFSLSMTAISPSIANSASKESVSESFLAEAMTKNILETAQSAGSFDTLLAAIKVAGLEDTLSEQGPFTVFAPTDEAFAALPEGTVEMLLKPENKDKLVKILTYHVVADKAKSSDLQAGSLQTVEGSPVMIELGDKVKVNSATVVKADIEASNGVIHVIDQVILPPDM